MVPQSFLFLIDLVESKRGLNKMDVNMDLKIKELDEFKDEINEMLCGRGGGEIVPDTSRKDRRGRPAPRYARQGTSRQDRRGGQHHDMLGKVHLQQSGRSWRVSINHQSVNMASSSVFYLSEEGNTDSEDEEYVESSTDTYSIGSLCLDIEDDMFIDAHFEEDVDTSMTKTTYDPFLYLLCPRHKEDAEIGKLYRGDEYEEEPYDDDDLQFGKHNWNADGENEEIGVEYNIHNASVDWRKMKPELGEKYESPEQLKFCVRNYVVANGFQLRFAKSDHDRILVVCGKENNKKSARIGCMLLGLEMKQLSKLNL
ncbi:unnamed protein product [Lactuca saligna]|uniref:Transposase MuDR plant domain-containing protein n=1 Tax=Lactuca saligna TaxID=75948 RepID=A0AA35Z8X2_LACSI|nr:unnamed protein product [Lactuca saligna]